MYDFKDTKQVKKVKKAYFCFEKIIYLLTRTVFPTSSSYNRITFSPTRYFPPSKIVRRLVLLGETAVPRNYPRNRARIYNSSHSLILPSIWLERYEDVTEQASYQSSPPPAKRSL
jgi:hypothetical protein